MSGRYRLYFGAFVLSTILLVGSALMAVLDALSVLAGGVVSTETGLLLRMLGAAGDWLVGSVVLGLLAAVFFVATVVSVLRSTSLPKSDRLAGMVGRLENEYPMLRRLDVKERVEPTTDDRADRLKQQYVDGEMSEREFEREMDRLLDDDESNREMERERY